MTLELQLVEPLLIALAFVRIVGVLLLAPLFSHPAVPARARAGVSIAMALLIAPGASLDGQLPEALGLAVVSEFVIGVAIGFTSSLIFSAIGLMSELIAVQGGLGAAATLDPSADTSSIIVAALMRTFALLVFLSIEGHHEVIRALWLSFERIPLGVPMGAPSFGAIAGLGSYVFETGLRLAAPLTIILFVSNLVIGVLGRTIPQLNLISIQLPAQIALTLFLLAIGAGVMFDSFAHLLETGVVTTLGAVLGAG